MGTPPASQLAVNAIITVAHGNEQPGFHAPCVRYVRCAVRTKYRDRGIAGDEAVETIHGDYNTGVHVGRRAQSFRSDGVRFLHAQHGRTIRVRIRTRV